MVTLAWKGQNAALWTVRCRCEEWGCGWIRLIVYKSTSMEHSRFFSLTRLHSNANEMASVSLQTASFASLRCVQCPNRRVHDRKCKIIALVPSSHHCLVLSCLVLSVSAVWTELATSQDCRRQKISNSTCFVFLQFCPVSKCGVNWVLSCLNPVSNLQLFSLKYIEEYWKLSWLVANSVHTTDTDKIRLCYLASWPQEWNKGLLKTVLSCLVSGMS